MPTLYHHPFSSCSRRVVTLLDITGLPAERRIVALERGEHRSDAYLAINPNHQVPAWVDGDFVLYESHAILRYLCAVHGLDAWYPGDTRHRARVDSWLDWVLCRFAPAESGIVFNTCFAGDDADRDAITRGHETLVELTALLDAHLADSAFLTGDSPTIADLSLASSAVQLPLAGVTLDGANSAAWLARVMAIPGFTDSLPRPPSERPDTPSPQPMPPSERSATR